VGDAEGVTAGPGAYGVEGRRGAGIPTDRAVRPVSGVARG